MLVLTRKRDEAINIGSNVVIRVTKIGKNSVKIGIEAPASVRVCRSEIATVQEVQFEDFLNEDEQSLLDDCVLEAMMQS